MNLRGKKVAVIGINRSGQSAARLLTQVGAQVKISDASAEKFKETEFYQWTRAQNIPMELSGHTRDFIEDNDLIVISPGVPQDALPLQWAREKGISVIGEIELGYQFCRAPIIAVTGSNGKTTVSTLIKDVLVRAGKKVFLGGNIGQPFCDDVLNSAQWDYAVLEISSFQLESIVKFKPKIAVWLNFSENHLDRHKDMQEYFDAKKRIFFNQDENDYAVLNIQQEKLRMLAAQLKARVVFFNSVDKIQAWESSHPNFLAVGEVAKICGIDRKVCLEVFRNFPGVEHRLEKVATLDGVDFINDSKATTAEAARWALERIEQPIIWICGGRDKHIDFSVLTPLVKAKVKMIAAIGEARPKIKSTFGDVVEVHEFASLEDAVKFSRTCAQQGDCVILSPMCSSFDMFTNFEERGKVFKEIVRKLKSEIEGAVRRS
ncbi:MAG: UDP-N-acetylmuramoyl-L-alanine--D-glutamate ligase [Candidatus Omnitrophica bacterium]|nr:UDP-N-acetylmuramoyl-L-alanine--D-glutamate ligase [Candidatus Omnitrophota bacterium]